MASLFKPSFHDRRQQLLSPRLYVISKSVDALDSPGGNHSSDEDADFGSDMSSLGSSPMKPPMTKTPDGRKRLFAKPGPLKIDVTYKPESEATTSEEVPKKRVAVDMTSPEGGLRRSPRKHKTPMPETSLTAKLRKDTSQSPKKPKSPKRLPTKANNEESEEEYHDAPEKPTTSSPKWLPAMPKKVVGSQQKASPKKPTHSDDDVSPFSSDDSSIDGEDDSGKPKSKVVCQNDRLDQEQYKIKPPLPKRTPYSREEDVSLINYIISTNQFIHLGGNNFWKEAEIELASGENRTWQSLKERFRKYICPNLKVYADVVSEEFVNDLKKNLPNIPIGW